MLKRKARTEDEKKIDTAMAGAMLGGKARWASLGDGLYARCTPKHKTYFLFRYWAGGRAGRPRDIPLGEMGAIMPDGSAFGIKQARQLAAIERGKLAEGKDPTMERKLIRSRITAETFVQAWQAYGERSGIAGNKTWAETQRIVAFDALPVFGDFPLKALESRHLTALRDKVKQRSPSSSRALWAALRPFFRWSREAGLTDNNPMLGLKAPDTSPGRNRFLTNGEVRAFWLATGGLGWPWRTVYRLIALTATRREEVAGMTWSELNTEMSVWTIPAARIKRTRKDKEPEDFIIDLPSTAVELLKDTPRSHEIVFSTTGTTPPSGWSKSKGMLDDAMTAHLSGLKHWQTHDLRRTAVHHMGETLGIDLEVRERVLNHRRKGLEGVYQTATLRQKRREALQQWDDYIRTLVNV